MGIIGARECDSCFQSLMRTITTTGDVMHSRKGWPALHVASYRVSFTYIVPIELRIDSKGEKHMF